MNKHDKVNKHNKVNKHDQVNKHDKMNKHDKLLNKFEKWKYNKISEIMKQYL